MARLSSSLLARTLLVAVVLLATASLIAAQADEEFGDEQRIVNRVYSSSFEEDPEMQELRARKHRPLGGIFDPRTVRSFSVL